MKGSDRNILVLNCVQEGVVEINPSGEILYLNHPLTQIFGYKESEIKNQNIFSFFDQQTEKLKAQLLQAQKNTNLLIEQKVFQEYKFRSKNGQDLWLSVTITPFYQNDIIETFFLFFTDVTQNKLQADLNSEIQKMGNIGGWELDVATGKTTWTDQTYVIHGIPVGTPTDKDMGVSFYASHEQERIEDFVNKCLSGQACSDVFEFVDAKGKPKWVNAMGKPLRDSKGAVVKVCGTFQDISQHIEKENKLLQLIDFNSAILASAKFSIISTDLNGLVTGFNKEAERVLGYKASEVVGVLNLKDFHDPNEIQAFSDEIRKERSSKTPDGFEALVFKAKKGDFDQRQWTYVGKEKRATQVQSNVTGLRNQKGDLYGFLSIAKDLTEELRIKYELEVEKAKSLHNSKLASLGEMSAGIAHEINNPLAIVMANVELLKRYKNDPVKFESKIESIMKASFRIQKIVSGLQKYSRSTKGNQFEIVSLSQIIEDSLFLVSSKAQNNSVMIDFQKQSDEKILCDSIEIEQVVVNLMSNAIDAVKSLSEKKVQVQFFKEKDKIVLRVIDSGPGITVAVEEKLFQPFFTTKPPGEGTGLGLSIVKGILKQHQATITLNRSFSSTCFEVQFPVINEECEQLDT